MKGTYFLGRLALVLALSFSLVLFASAAETPTAQIRATVDKVLDILKDPSLTKDQRRWQLRETICPRFEFHEMAARSLGMHWKRLSPKEKEEFEEVFFDLLQDTYADRIESYQGEKVHYAGEAVDGSYAEVKTIVAVGKKKTDLSIGYKLIRTDGDWKIYDVVIENVSLVNNYRAQFDRIITQSSFEELLRRIREKHLGGRAKGQS